MNQAEFLLYTGPMFSSKTTRLLSRIDRSKYQKKKTISFKPQIDDRYSVDNQIVTHNDNHIQSCGVESGKDILDIVVKNQPIDAVAVDEIFMIPGGAKACIELFKAGYDVYVSSIELDFKGNPFYEKFSSMTGVKETLKKYEERFVIKEDGLRGGKGVLVRGDNLRSMEEALAHCQSLVDKNISFVIEVGPSTLLNIH